LDQPREELEQQFASMTARFEEAATTAPGEVAADVMAFNTIYGRVVDAFRAAEYDVTRLAPEDVAALSSPELEAALQHISAYDTRVCR
jgi:hypothetical protein